MEIRYASEEHMPVVVAITLQELAYLESWVRFAATIEDCERTYAALDMADVLAKVRKQAMERAMSSFTYELNRDK